ncbi:hypothetical protein IVB27_24260 [Bradyrhizobium sp. 197]|uniref:hypothetical protein n=1 Tax=Bradyrhizobium sp. 197 TaxID=2782663 RepID=UPI001FFA43AE|nr:hypothetical protein [Bradyrhizobium sp. 197]MCK1477831.1 hypothetical protein [Bradyrhizobium sp. 197]
MKIHGDFDQTSQLLVPLRRGRRLDVSTGRMCPCRVRVAGGLDEDVASLHAAFLHDMLNRKLSAAARFEFSNDRTFQVRAPWLDESANNRPARTRFLWREPHLTSGSEPDDPEQDKQRDSDHAGDQQRA